MNIIRRWRKRRRAGACNVVFIYLHTGTFIFHRWVRVIMNSIVYSLHVLFIYLLFYLNHSMIFIRLLFILSIIHQKRVCTQHSFWGRGEVAWELKKIVFSSKPKNFQQQLFSFRQRRWKMVSFNYHISPHNSFTHMLFRLLPFECNTTTVYMTCMR